MTQFLTVAFFPKAVLASARPCTRKRSEEAYLSSRSPIKKIRGGIEKYFGNVNITIANNLPDLQQPALSIIEKKQGKLKLIFIARIVEIKNLKLLLENLQFIKSNVELTIAGPVEDLSYWNSCLAIIDKFPSNITTNYIGEITPNQVMPLIQKHHLYCLPTQGENFGHSIFEVF